MGGGGGGVGLVYGISPQHKYFVALTVGNRVVIETAMHMCIMIQVCIMSQQCNYALK